MMNKIKLIVRKAFKTGFFAIVGTSTLSKVITLFGGVVFVRILSKEDYGTYTYINNIFTMLILLSDFGSAASFMQFASEHYDDLEKKDTYFNFLFKRGIVFSFITSAIVLLSPLVYPYSGENTSTFVAALFLIPFVNTVNMFINSILRSSLENTKFAKWNLFSSGIYYVYILPLAYFFGVAGAVFAKYAITITSAIFGYIQCKGLYQIHRTPNKLTTTEKKECTKLAFATTLNTAVTQLMLVFDLFCIGLFITDTEILATYKVGTILPSALLFIPTAIMIYFVPLYARNKENISWIKKSTRNILGLGVIVYSLVMLGVFILSPYIVSVLFGSQYTDAIPILTVLMVGFIFSAAIRIPLNNIIYTQRKVNVNIAMSIFSTCLNITLNIILVPQIGSMGAAIASTFVMVISSVIMLVYFIRLLKTKANNLEIVGENK